MDLWTEYKQILDYVIISEKFMKKAELNDVNFQNKMHNSCILIGLQTSGEK